MTKFSVPSRLYVICDADVCDRAGWALDDFASACLDGGARWLQVRGKNLPGNTLLALSQSVVQRASAHGATVIVNDRADIARISGAAGVHIGQDDLSPEQARLLLAGNAVVGLSTHTPDQLEAAGRARIDYVAIGPVYDTASKASQNAIVGVEGVRVARAGIAGVPLVAIGGITLERARQVLDAGAQAVAVIADLLSTGDPAARVAEYLRALRNTS